MKSVDRRTKIQITADLGRLATYLTQYSATKQISANKIVRGAKLKPTLQPWVVRALSALAQAGSLTRTNRIWWTPVPALWTTTRICRVLGVTGAEEALRAFETAQPAAVAPPAPPAPRVREPLRTDQFQRALKAEYFDRLVAKYGADTIKDALGVATLP